MLKNLKDHFKETFPKMVIDRMSVKCVDYRTSLHGAGIGYNRGHTKDLKY